jgi:3-dehydroquinate dehydratase-2
MTKPNKILVLHGPNLNMLGTREPKIYGTITLNEIDQNLIRLGRDNNIEVICYQSNHEGDLITYTQQANQDEYLGIIINPAGYTHTSIAWRDALLAVNVPFIEVHLSNLFAREEFRHKSYFCDIATGVIAGFGAYGYTVALQSILSTAIATVS